MHANVEKRAETYHVSLQGFDGGENIFFRAEAQMPTAEMKVFSSVLQQRFCHAWQQEQKNSSTKAASPTTRLSRANLGKKIQLRFFAYVFTTFKRTRR